MLIMQGREGSGVSFFPAVLPHRINAFTAVELKSWLRVAPFLLFAEIVLMYSLINGLVFQNQEQKTLASTAFFGILLATRILLRKGLRVENKRVNIVGFAPTQIWLEHSLFCLCGGLAGLINMHIAVQMSYQVACGVAASAFFVSAFMPLLCRAVLRRADKGV